jgi:hypothetical protein
MLARTVDYLLMWIAKCGISPIAKLSYVPVMHVERLYDDSSFYNILEFVRRYLDAVGVKAILTVITPAAPLLRYELERVGFGEEAYAERIRALSKYADIGVHGHYLREPARAGRPIHNYWSDKATVISQLRCECVWLESRGLMRRRVYSAGWWYLDSSVLHALDSLDFEFDFSASKARFNSSPAASAINVSRGHPGIFQYKAMPNLSAIWAVSSLGGSASRSFVPRRSLSAFPSILVRSEKGYLSLYSHDWDLNVEGAMRTITDLKSHGAKFVSLDQLAAHLPPLDQTASTFR